MATGDFIEFHRDNDKRRESLFFVRLTLRRCGEKEEKKKKKRENERYDSVVRLFSRVLSK